jgi:uncharacterized protein
MRSDSLNAIRRAIALLLIALPAAAQDSTALPWKRHTIESTRLKEKRQIIVALPDGYAGDRQYPVLILLDANDAPQFTAAVANVRFLASRNTIPALIVVGIPNGKDRTHDLMPAATGETAKTYPTAGGADAFADFIADEVLPLVRSTYRTRPTTVFAGHSFGGITALHIAATRAGTYAGIIAMSPSLWWNDASAVAQYADAIARSPKRQRIFATSGSLEPNIDRPTQKFAERLRGNKTTTAAFAYRHYEDDTHGLTPQPSLVDGLRFVFEPISGSKLPIARINAESDSASVVNAVLQSQTMYARNSADFGDPELLPVDQLNALGSKVLQTLKKPGLAVWVFRRNVALHPQSANAHHGLAYALLAKGDTAAAIAELKRAIDIGTRTNHAVTADSRDKLKQLEKGVTQAGKAKP